MEFHELTNVHVYEDGYVRGLPREAQAELRSVALAWDGHAERRWCSFVGVAADLVAELQMLGCSARTHEGSPGPYRQPVTMMTPEEAEQATGEMTGLYGIIETRVIRLTHLATEFVKRRGWVALGYESLDEYSAERLPFRLPREARKEIVMQLVADGISMRAAAAITRTSKSQVSRDLAGSTVPNGTVGMDGRETQPRRTYEPDPVWAAVEAHLGGADGITVHLREDRRHIQDQDVRRLRELTHIKLNLEMAATDEMVGIACQLRPEMAMLVPEGRAEVTTEGGLDVAGQEGKIKAAVDRLAAAGIMTSVFIDAELPQVEASARAGARVCEIHTGPYAHAYHAKGRDSESTAVLVELDRVRTAGRAIRDLGMRFNAGHALNYVNVQPVAAIPGVRELHIGHAIVARSVFVGLREAVREMKALMRQAA